MVPTIELDDDAHRAYLIDAAGRREVTRMTTALASVRIVDRTHFTDESRIRGQAIHAAMLADFQGGYVYSGLAPGYWDGYLAFKAETRFQAVLCEQPVADPDAGYAGQFDLWGRLPDLPMSASDLIDLKSGTAPPWVAIQTMGYRRCLGSLGLAALPTTRVRRWALELPGNSRYKLIPLNMDEGSRIDPHLDDLHERVALGAIAVANWKRDHL
jgi:hypothetical protein